MAASRARVRGAAAGEREGRLPRERRRDRLREVEPCGGPAEWRRRTAAATSARRRKVALRTAGAV